jgi:signal transduction histidine kinase
LLLATLVLLLAILPSRSLAADTNIPPKRVLILNSFGTEFAPFTMVTSTFRAELTRQLAVPVEFNEVSVEFAERPEIQEEEAFMDYLQSLYKGRNPDLIVVEGEPAAFFISHNGKDVFPGVPALVAIETRSMPVDRFATNVVAFPIQMDMASLVEDIERVLPKTTNIVVITGTSILEHGWLAQMEQDCARFTNRIKFRFEDASLDKLCRGVAKLPPNSAIYFISLITDIDGIPHDDNTAIAALHETANAPIFGLLERQLGFGIVGGRLLPLQTWNKRVVNASLQILNGKSINQISSEITGPGEPIYDWRELQRWNINMSRLPPGSEIRFRQLTTWEQYKWEIIGAVALCLAEAALILALLLQMSRRRQAELENQRSRDELAHIARVSTMGQLASTLAHELNQPLGAILRNAEAAELYLQRNPPDNDEVMAILADIRRDDQRAGAVIDRMRSLLKRRELQFEPVSLRKLIEEVVQLTRIELEARQVKLLVQLAPNLPPVRGDGVQLQQVLLNLLFNGADAMKNLPSERRHLVVRAHGEGRNVEVSVKDGGHGIPADKLAQVFEPFFTTKDHGLGMGLAISQTIIETHGGRIQAENNPDGGACFRFTVPVAKTGGSI